MKHEKMLKEWRVSDESEEVRVAYTNAMLRQGHSRVQGHLSRRIFSPSVGDECVATVDNVLLVFVQLYYFIITNHLKLN